ncbi:FKBP-type peptidyl-prolyl cis-trans isomerase [Butyrivibrio fibrisolvens]|uniref:FKBP-type peptidyl-prolyl cis-trans isomerase n=1 Tax=Butyrivibrio fibrisolvens TaxID=831 RepID=UPI0003B6C159|nr:FKBP-type peptidyl-prolyl cis-trans isomerase [Butyrivibrio fibrisolvens]
MKNHQEETANTDMASKNNKEIILSKKEKRCLVVGILVATITMTVFSINKFIDTLPKKVKASTNFSKYLTTTGVITEKTPEYYIGLVNIENLGFTADDLDVTDARLEQEISELLADYTTTYTDPSAEVEEYDTVNVEYICSIDGEEYSEASTNGIGVSITIGSEEYVTGFEPQIVGMHPGETKDINVTFPEDYNSESFAGKTATFTITVNSVTKTADLTDEIAVSLSGNPTMTADAYRQMLKDSLKEDMLNSYISSYLDSLEPTSYPEGYLYNVAGLTKTINDEAFEDYVASTSKTVTATSYAEFNGITDEEYENELITNAKEDVIADLFWMEVYDTYLGTPVTDDIFASWMANYGIPQDAIDTYGRGYLVMALKQEAAYNYICNYFGITSGYQWDMYSGSTTQPSKSQESNSSTSATTGSSQE